MTVIRFEEVRKEFRKHQDVDLKMPARAHYGDAGYDFISLETVTIQPQESYLFWTDIKVFMQPGIVLQIYPRSSLAVKRYLILKNQVGIIDSSYYNNENNDGNIGICLYNCGKEPQTINIGDRIAQGIFTQYFRVDDAEYFDSDRVGGFGSTGK